MKDKNDISTQEMFAPRPVGRPRQHHSNADRQRAYRKRKTMIDLIREAKNVKS